MSVQQPCDVVDGLAGVAVGISDHLPGVHHQPHLAAGRPAPPGCRRPAARRARAPAGAAAGWSAPRRPPGAAHRRRCRPGGPVPGRRGPARGPGRAGSAGGPAPDADGIRPHRACEVLDVEREDAPVDRLVPHPGFTLIVAWVAIMPHGPRRTWASLPTHAGRPRPPSPRTAGGSSAVIRCSPGCGPQAISHLGDGAALVALVLYAQQTQGRGVQRLRPAAGRHPPPPCSARWPAPWPTGSTSAG